MNLSNKLIIKKYFYYIIALNYKPLIHKDSGLIRVQIGGSSDLDLIKDTKDHLIKVKPKTVSDESQDEIHLPETLLTSLEKVAITTEPRDHLLNVIKSNEADDNNQASESKDHLLNVIQRMSSSIATVKVEEDASNKVEFIEARDHLLNIGNDVEENNKFSGNIFGLVYNQFR